MTNKLVLLSLIIFGQIGEQLACFGAKDYGNEWDDYLKGKSKNKIPKEYWNIPANQKSVFGKWIKEYKANYSRMKKEERTGESPVPVPESWKGFGRGHGGQDPPPWAIIPNGYGKPGFCFEEPDAGNCTYNLKRWGFNSYEGECRQFTYTGCGGNNNNFVKKARCEESCKHDPTSNCQKYGEYIEYK